MAKYIIKRVLYMLLVFFALSLLIFLIYNLIPSDKAYEMARTECLADKRLVFNQRYLYWQRAYGLDGSMFQRYLRWLGMYPYYNGEYKGLFQGYLGSSIMYGKPVTEVIKEPMKNTIFINLFATVLALGITIPLGIFCAVKRGSKRDSAIQVGTIVGYSIPTYVVALVFMWFFSIVLGIFPVSGMETTGANYTGFRAFIDRLYYMALPLIVMTFCSLGGMTRYVRAAMIESLSMDCIRTARAKGLREKTVIYSHAWRNALVPIVILIIGWFLGIFSGSLMIENIFSLNGIGKAYYVALTNNDNEVVLALQMFYVVIGLLGNLITDLVYGLIDPRIRVTK